MVAGPPRSCLPGHDRNFCLHCGTHLPTHPTTGHPAVCLAFFLLAVAAFCIHPLLCHWPLAL